MYQNTQKNTVLWNMKLKHYVVIQKIKKLKKKYKDEKYFKI